MLQPCYVFAVLFKGHCDMLAIFLHSGSMPVLEVRRTEHYVASTSDLQDAVCCAGVNFYPLLRSNFALRDVYATPCELRAENALALLLHLHKVSHQKAA